MQLVGGGQRQVLDASGTLKLERGGWVVLRAWNAAADPAVLDRYPYATTSPVYLGAPAPQHQRREDAAYFVTWMERVIAAAEARLAAAGTTGPGADRHG